VHLVVARTSRVDVAVHGRERGRHRRRREHHLAQLLKRLGAAARRDEPRVPDDEALRIGVDCADVQARTLVVRLRDLAQQPERGIAASAV
jgi:hypothetical protein